MGTSPQAKRLHELKSETNSPGVNVLGPRSAKWELAASSPSFPPASSSPPPSSSPLLFSVSPRKVNPPPRSERSDRPFLIRRTFSFFKKKINFHFSIPLTDLYINNREIVDEKYFAAAGAVIACKDGSRTFSKDRLNDGYCDCLDGTDEPGKSQNPPKTPNLKFSFHLMWCRKASNRFFYYFFPVRGN